jgi:hypothetical protein
MTPRSRRVAVRRAYDFRRTKRMPCDQRPSSDGASRYLTPAYARFKLSGIPVHGRDDLNPTYSPSLRKPTRSSDKKDWRLASV